MKKFFLASIVSSVLSEEILLLDQTPIIDYVNNLEGPWTAGFNKKFEGMTLHEIKSFLGTRNTPQSLRLPEKVSTLKKDIPQEFLSSEHWPHCQSIKQVRDQSTCGGCWAVAAAEVMSDRICIASGQTLQTRISAEDILSCCGPTCGSGCFGGWTSGAWTYFTNVGVVTGWNYDDKKWCSAYSFPPCDHHTEGRYEPCGSSKQTPTCKETCGNGANYEADKWKAESSYSIPLNVEQIQTEIMENGPVQGSYTVYLDFITYKSGVYQHISGPALGSHSIRIVGWGVEENQSYWLVANNWNEDWGDNGFFKILRGKNQCGIESQVVAGIPKIKQQSMSTQ